MEGNGKKRWGGGSVGLGRDKERRKKGRKEGKEGPEGTKGTEEKKVKNEN